MTRRTLFTSLLAAPAAALVALSKPKPLANSPIRYVNQDLPPNPYVHSALTLGAKNCVYVWTFRTRHSRQQWAQHVTERVFGPGKGIQGQLWLYEGRTFEPADDSCPFFVDLGFKRQDLDAILFNLAGYTLVD